jgi:SAM-dependent methyltransferase
MSTHRPIAFPPIEYRRMVGPTQLEAFDNPTAEPIYPELPQEVYDAVFDFGCGCGRLARRLLQQKPRPRRYVGTDLHRGMIEWCIENLSPIDPNFQFFHHDVYSPQRQARDNSYQLAAPFPGKDEEFSLVIAHSVFTHLYQQQAEYYLYEVARILRPRGVAFTSWFFFDKESFPFLREGPFCLHAGEEDPLLAVIYDRKWFIDTVRRFGLGVRFTVPPLVAGHQWQVFLEKRTPKTVDRFPLGEDGAEWLSGATAKPMAKARISQAEIEKTIKVGSAASAVESQVLAARPPLPALFGPLAELAAIKRSWTWTIGHAIIKPLKVMMGRGQGRS